MLRAADLAVRWGAGISLAALTVCVLAGVVSRGLGEPLHWTDELSRYLMVWTSMFGWILAGRKRLHIRVRFFHDLLPPRAHAIAEIVMQATVAWFGLLCVVYGAELVERNYDIEAISLPLTNMWLYIPLVFAGGVSVLQAAADAFDAWKAVP